MAPKVAPKKLVKIMTTKQDDSQDDISITDESNYDTTLEESEDSESIAPENDMLKFITQDIDEEYAYGKYGDFNVMIRKSDGYINATKLCKNAGKRMSNWYSNLANRKLIQEILDLGLDKITTHLMYTITTGKLLTRGTYVHPDLILAIALWCSTEYYIKVSTIMKEYHMDEMRKSNEDLIADNKEKACKIDHMIAMMKKAEAKQKKREKEHAKEKAIRDKQIAELLANSADILDNNKGLKKNIKKVSKQNISIKKDTRKIAAKLDIACDDRVMPATIKEENYVIIIKNNDPAELDDDSEEDSEEEVEHYPYYCMRVQHKSRNAALKKRQVKYPDYEIIAELSGVPNAIRLWNNVKNDLVKKKKVIMHGNDFELGDTLTERQFIRKINNIYDKRMDI
jgi:hypothetical protein